MDNQPERNDARSHVWWAMGLDRLGLVALAAPYLSAALILLLSALAVLGVMRLKVDDSLSELFRTDTAEFRRYEEVDRRFPSSEYDVLAVVEGKGLLTRQGLDAFTRMILELQFAEAQRGVVSMLSARKPEVGGVPGPILPNPLPEGSAFDEAVKALRANDIVKGKFLSDDGELALVLIALDRVAVEKQGAAKVIGAILESAEKELKDSGLTVKLTGAPVMQLEIRNAVERDRLVYNGLGFLLGAGIALLFFRRFSLMLIAVLGPTTAILWTLGVIGGLDFRLNLFINVITPLILVSGFSDSMHLVTAIRRDIMAGVDRIEAARNAVREVAPACLLTATLQALALASFVFAKSALIKTFGIAALMAVAISYTAVAVVVPTLAALLIRREKHPVADREEAGADGGMGFLRRMSEGIVRMVGAYPLPWLAAGIIAVAATGYGYAQLEPHYRLADQVPDKEHALAATGRLDQKLTGASPVHVMVQWREGASLYDPATLKAIGDAHAVLLKTAGLGNVWSMESLRLWLKEAGDDRIETLKKYVSVLPEHLVQRFVNEREKSVLITGRLPDVDASKILPVVDAIEKALAPVKAANPAFEFSVTGLPAIAARNSARLISELNIGLVGDIFIVFIVLALALRSVLAGVSSVIPSVFPIFATGALLYATGEGLQFASIIAITVAFSLAIDSTIHFLNRFSIEERRLPVGPGNATEALRQTIHHIGPAVVLTTIVLTVGLGVTVLSHLPSLRLFGRLTAVCLFASLVAQLFILPASVAMFRRIWPRRA